MNEITTYIPAAIAVVFVLLLAIALVIKSWRDGSLKTDIKWVRSYVRIYRASKKTHITN